MNTKNIINKIKPPCSKCPYKLGQVKTFVNPCPECRQNNYNMFQQFQDMLPAKNKRMEQ